MKLLPQLIEHEDKGTSEATNEPTNTKHSHATDLQRLLALGATLTTLAACAPLDQTATQAPTPTYEHVSTILDQNALLFEKTYPFAMNIPRTEMNVQTNEGKQVKFMLLEPFNQNMLLDTESIKTWITTISSLTLSTEPVFEPFVYNGEAISFKPLYERAYSTSLVVILPPNVASVVDPNNPDGTGGLINQTISTLEGQQATFVIPDYANLFDSANLFLRIELCQQTAVLVNEDLTFNMLEQELWCNGIGTAAHYASKGIPYEEYAAAVNSISGYTSQFEIPSLPQVTPATYDRLAQLSTMVLENFP